MSGMTHFFSGPETYFSVFTDLDLGVYVHNPGKKMSFQGFI